MKVAERAVFRPRTGRNTARSAQLSSAQAGLALVPGASGETVAWPLQTAMPLGIVTRIGVVSSGAMICRPWAVTHVPLVLATSEVTIRKLASLPGANVISVSAMWPAKSSVVLVALVAIAAPDLARNSTPG